MYACLDGFIYIFSLIAVYYQSSLRLTLPLFVSRCSKGDAAS